MRVTQDKLGRELAEARAEITALREQIAELQAGKRELSLAREGYETRIAELLEELARSQPEEPWEQPISDWLAQQVEWRHPSHRILANAVGIARHLQDPSAGRRLAPIMRKLGWQNRLVVDDDNRRVRGWIKPRYR